MTPLFGAPGGSSYKDRDASPPQHATVAMSIARTRNVWGTKAMIPRARVDPARRQAIVELAGNLDTFRKRCPADIACRT
jgi:hypothetical protein